MEIRKISTLAIAAGTTSSLALMASVTSATAGEDGFYMGFSTGAVWGDNPSPGDADEDDYHLGGSITSMFVGINRSLDNGMFAGVELSYNPGFEGDADDDSSYEYAYDVNYNVDAKLRLGKELGNISVYGFVGVSSGSVSTCCYGADYRYSAYNAGVGAEMDVANGIFIGAEYIHRFTSGVAEDTSGYNRSHGAASVRAGFRF